MIGRISAVLLAVGLGSGALGCGPQAFEPQFPERAEPELTRVLRALESVSPTGEIDPVVVAVRAEPPGLRAVALDDGAVRWEVDADVRTTPLLAGPFVVLVEGEAIVGRRLSDGAVAFEAGAGRLLGAQSDGERVVVSIAEGPEQSPRGRLVLATDGGAVWSHELSLPMGVAAIANDIVVVPWATQRVSFLDAADGLERTRLRFADRVVGRTWVSGDRLLIGQHDVLRVGPELEEPRSIESWQPAGRPLPGQPPLLADGYAPVPEPTAASNRVRLAWRASAGELGATDDLLYLVFYRQLFALAAEADEARWVRIAPSDVVAATPVEGGVWIVTEDGTARLLDAANGRPVAERSLGGPVVAAALRAGPVDAPAASDGPTLREQLLAAAELDDNRLGGGRALAVRLLGRFGDAEVTEHLVRLCGHRASPEPARRAACDAVATRTEGAGHVRAALAHHGSFLADRPPPPVGALARAAASMSIRGAAPTLLRHLEDPSTPAEELVDLLSGLGALGVASVAPRLEAFVRLYHASGDPALSRAVVAGALAVRTLDARRGEALIAALGEDPMTPPAVRAGIERSLAEEAAEAQRAQAAERSAVVAREAAAQPAPAPRDDRPERIDGRITAQVFRPVERPLRRCLPDGVPSMRISMVVDGDGEIGVIAVGPSEAQECVEPIVRQLRFPATRLGLREQIVHRVRR